jgi:hypothetical protein
MVALVLGMLVCLGLAVAVVALVAVPARRQGRQVLTPRGDEVVGSLRDRTDAVRARLDRGDAPADAGEGAAPGGEVRAAASPGAGAATD